MMARELVVPWSRARMYFWSAMTIAPLLNSRRARGRRCPAAEMVRVGVAFPAPGPAFKRRSRRAGAGTGPRLLDDPQNQAGDDAAQQRADDGDPRVVPIRVALAGNGQQEMGNTRPQVAGRVDRVAGRAAE